MVSGSFASITFASAYTAGLCLFISDSEILCFVGLTSIPCVDMDTNYTTNNAFCKIIYRKITLLLSWVKKEGLKGEPTLITVKLHLIANCMFTAG